MNALLILNFNSHKLIKVLLNEVHDFDSISYIVIVDNNSSEISRNGILDIESKFEKVKCLISDSNGGYSKGNNIGLRWLSEHTNVENVFVSNPDILFSESYIDSISEKMIKNKEYGLLTGIMLDPDGNITRNQYWDLYSVYREVVRNLFFLNFFFQDNNKLIDRNRNEEIVDVVPAGSLICVRLEYIKEIGFFDEDFFLFFEESSICNRLKKLGYKYGIFLGAEYYHYHSQTINTTLKIQKKLKIYYESMLIYQKKYNSINRIQEIILVGSIKINMITSLTKSIVRNMIWKE